MAGRLDGEPYAFQVRKDGAVAVTHEGRQVSVIAGRDAERLIAKLQRASAEEVQMALAKITGNFKRGNERMASGHTRNR